MALTDVSIKIDETIKDKFEDFCEELGLSMSVAINLFMRTVVREQKIPFELSLKPSDLEDSKIFGPYDTVDEAMKAMLSDE